MTAREFLDDKEARKRSNDEWQREEYERIARDNQGDPIPDELSDAIDKHPYSFRSS